MLFERQTIARLAPVVEVSPTLPIAQETVGGELPLTPIQHWFFEQEFLDAHHWNQALHLEVRQCIDSALLEQAVRHVTQHHDALRLRFIQEKSSIQQRYADSDTSVLLTQIDLSEMAPTEQRQSIEATATELQTSLNLSEGPLWRVALINLGDNRPRCLLIVIHHLVVDGVSWRILLEDLQTAYQQLSQGEAIELPSKTTSYQQWAQQLRNYARSPDLQQELEYWLAEPCQPISSLPVDFPEGDNAIANARTVSVTLNPDETQALLWEVPSAYSTQINDVLLTALVQAFARWTGESRLLVNLEGHGREDIFETVNLSRTVGWFTTIFPVLLEIPTPSQPGEALKSVKEQLRRIPNRGIGYGIVRYLHENRDVTEPLKSPPQAEVVFNYLGQLDRTLPDSSMFKLTQESVGLERSPRGTRPYLLEINGFVVGSQLRLDWIYSQAVHQQTTICSLAEDFLEALRSLIAHCQSSDAGGYTPSDFPDV
ncbi:MAG TPA: non-ribosomal peptide synthetase, partial [Cyanobacteria bacterium UBA8553]|nr:non-ribosomal peptide synthetase [Cyanobacteria bacterium UBA8553]